MKRDKEKKEEASEEKREGPSQYYYTVHMLLSVRNMRTPWATYHSLLHREEEMKRFYSELKVKSIQIP